MRNATPTGAARRVVCVILLASAMSAPAYAASLPTTHVPDVVREHAVMAVGLPDPATPMQLSIALPMRNQDALDAALKAIYDRASPQYRHYLSLGEFTYRFGPTQSDYQTATQYFEANGLHVTATSANRYIIDVNGPVSAVDKVLHLTLRLYRHPTENRNFVAPDREPTVDLSVPLLHVSGLSDYSLPQTRHVASANAQARYACNAGGSGPGGCFIGSDMRAAYYGGGSLDGHGQVVGLMELVGYNAGDIDRYFHEVGQTLNVPIVGVSVDGKTPATCTQCDDGEQVLDIDYAVSVAPGLRAVKVYVARNPVTVLNAMAANPRVLQFSTSWGWERDGDDTAVEDPIYKEMAAQGQTFLTASGDYSSLKASGTWPEEDAYLTAVGGTDLVTTSAGGAYKTETGWSGSAGGPSVDKAILIPDYQVPFINARNMGSHTLRNVPDVAANANTNMYICATFALGGGQFKRGCEGGWGGTSFASPMWAGFVALANQQAAQNGKPAIGFLPATLYPLAGTSAYDTILHDVIGGKSGKYTAVKGYDLVTGLGSPNGQALIDALAP